ncbi:hypothetical protein EBU99_10920 [bacterium]|nr:hypothetical protein [bacterium]
MNDSPNRRASASVQIIGIHVAGASTHKTSLVRARCVVKELQSGTTDPQLHALVCKQLQTGLGQIPMAAAGSHFESESAAQKNSPLFWEAFSSELGPVPNTDPDSNLMQTISDLGGAQIFCLDAPLTLPSCSTCVRVCPGVPLCPESAVQGLLSLWNEDNQSEDKRPKMPLPHTERYFEAYARRRYEHPGFAGGLDIESVLSSNRAPVAARAQHLSRRLKHTFPNAIVVETHPWLAAVGWALHAGYRLNHVAELRQPDAGRIARAGLLRKLELQRLALRSATFIEDLFVELSEDVEIFAATIAAMSAWGLLNGLCDLQPSFLQQGLENPLLGWALVPRELATYGWGH